MRIFFAWYDCWIGWFYDRKQGVLYVCPFPMLVFQFGRPAFDEPKYSRMLVADLKQKRDACLITIKHDRKDMAKLRARVEELRGYDCDREVP